MRQRQKRINRWFIDHLINWPVQIHFLNLFVTNLYICLPHEQCCTKHLGVLKNSFQRVCSFQITLRAEVFFLHSFWRLLKSRSTRLTSDTNDFLNAKSNARKKPLLAQVVSDRIGIWKCWFLSRGGNRGSSYLSLLQRFLFSRQKALWAKGENQQQILELSDRVRSTKRHSRRGRVVTFPYGKSTPSREPVRLIWREIAQACMTHEDNSQIAHHGEAKLRPESMRNAALLGLMQPNLETGARRTGRYTLFGLAGGNFREIDRFVWNLLAFARWGSAWRSPAFPSFIVFSTQWIESRLNGV